MIVRLLAAAVLMSLGAAGCGDQFGSVSVRNDTTERWVVVYLPDGRLPRSLLGSVIVEPGQSGVVAGINVAGNDAILLLTPECELADSIITTGVVVDVQITYDSRIPALVNLPESLTASGAELAEYPDCLIPLRRLKATDTYPPLPTVPSSPIGSPPFETPQ